MAEAIGFVNSAPNLYLSFKKAILLTFDNFMDNYDNGIQMSLLRRFISIFRSEESHIEPPREKVVFNLEIHGILKSVLQMKGIYEDAAKLRRSTLHLQNIFGAGALEEARSRLKRVETIEPAIKRIIKSATGDENSVSSVALEIRQKISHSSDPESEIQSLMRYVRMTDQLISVVRLKPLNKKHSQILGVKPKVQELESLYKKLRQFLWSNGVRNVEGNAKAYLKAHYKDDIESREYKLHYRSIFERPIPKKPKPRDSSKSKVAENSMLQEELAPERQRTKSEVLILLRRLSSAEDSNQRNLQIVIDGFAESLDNLERELVRYEGDLTVMMGIYGEHHKEAKELLEKKEFLLSAILREHGKIDGYETSQEIITLIKNPKSVERTQVLQATNDVLPITGDLEEFNDYIDDDEIADCYKQVRDRRQVTADLHNCRHRSEQKIEFLNRSIKARILEIEKITNRSELLEDAIKDLRRDIHDLELERRNGHRNIASSRLYPPLNQLEIWANDNLKGRVQIHRNAFNLAAGMTDTHKHPEWVYQGLELLAHEYWEQITSGDYDQNTARNLRAAFADKLGQLHMRIGGSIAEIRNDRIRQQYQATFDGERMFLDQHLRRGTSRDPDNILCIYFAWRQPTRTILVGHLPTHLEISRT